jgi:hypothetical protein
MRRHLPTIYDHVDLPIFPSDQIAVSITGMWPCDEERNALPMSISAYEAIGVLEEYLKLAAQNKQMDFKLRGTAFEDGVFRPRRGRDSDV